MKFFCTKVQRRACMYTVAVWLMWFGTINLSPAQQRAEADPGIVRIKVTEEFAHRLEATQMSRDANNFLHTGIQSLDRVNVQHKVNAMKRVFRPAGRFEAKHRKYGLHRWYEIQMDKSVHLAEALASYQTLESVEKVEFSYAKQISGSDKPGFGPVRVTEKELPRLTLPAASNDPMLGSQWHYENTGQNDGTPGADISLLDAWGIETGNPNVVVAVTDGGAQVNHPDLAANMWVNADEIPGNRIDDDHNGFIDDINGYGFLFNSGNIVPDDHATHVSGTIAAVTNNGVGVAGIAGGSGTGDGARIMTLATFGTFSNFGIPESFVYGGDNGAVISSNSWGYTLPGVFESVVRDGIDYFIAEAGTDENGHQVGPMKGGLVVFTAHNFNSNGEWYPGFYDKTLAVAALNNQDKKADYSNFGDWVDVSAPGGERFVANDPRGVLSTITGGQYAFFEGTSMAAPHVSGVAALIVSKFGGVGFTPQLLRERLTQFADNIDAVNPNFIGALGTGRINAFKALQHSGLRPPFIRVSPATITETLQTAQIMTRTVDIFNAGENVLNFQFGNLGTNAFATPLPFSGSVAAGETLHVNVTIDANRLFPGSYSQNLVLQSNDPENLSLTLPVSLDVSSDGNPIASAAPDRLDFGLVPQLDVAMKTFTVHNAGTGMLSIASITSSTSKFTTDFTEPLTVPPFHEAIITVTYTPGGLGVDTGSLSITTNDPLHATLIVPLAGEGISLPAIEVTPASLSATLNTGRTEIQTLTLKNAGGTNLEFAVNVAANDPQAAVARVLILTPDGDVRDIEATLDAFDDVEADKFPVATLPAITLADLEPYDVVFLTNNTTWKGTGNVEPKVIGDLLADYIDAGGKVISNQFTYSFDEWKLEGRFIDGQYGPFLPATRNVTRTVDLNILTSSNPVMKGVSALQVTGLIQNVRLVPGITALGEWNNGMPALAANDNVVAFNLLPSSGNGTRVSISGDLPLLYQNAIHYLTGLRFVRVNPVQGVIAAGAELNLDVTFDATGLDSTRYEALIRISTNVPDQRFVTVPAVLNGIGEEFKVNVESLSEELAKNQTSVRTIVLTNDGPNDQTFALITEDFSFFSVSPLSGNLPSGSSVSLQVTFDSKGLDFGMHKGNISIQLAEKKLTVVALLRVFGDPEIDVDPTFIEETVDHGEEAIRTLTITNTGGNPLEYDLRVIGADLSALAMLKNKEIFATSDKTKEKQAVDEGEPRAPERAATVMQLFTGTPLLKEDFEDATFPPAGWQAIDNEGRGVVWQFAAGYRYDNFTGGTGEAATVSSNRLPFIEHDAELITPEVSTQGFRHIAVQYNVNYINFTGLDLLELDIQVDNGAWTTVVSWSENHGTRFGIGVVNTVSLEDYIGNGSSFRLRWHYYNPDHNDFDEYAQIDDVIILGDPKVWLSVSPAFGTVPVQGKAEIEVRFSSEGINPGSHVAGILVASNAAEDPQAGVLAQLTVRNPPVMTITPASLSQELFVGEQATQTITIANSGASDLKYEFGNTPLPSNFVTSTAQNVPVTKRTERSTDTVDFTDTRALQPDVELLGARTTLYTTGFEGFAAGDINRQQGWVGEFGTWVISTSNPFEGTQHLRAISDGLGSTRAFSPRVAIGTDPVSSVTLRIQAGRNVTWSVVPQTAGNLLNTRININANGFLSALIMNPDFSSALVPIPVQLPDDRYAEMRIEVQRATAVFTLFIDGEEVFTGQGFARNIEQVVFLSTMQVSGPVLDVDNLAIYDGAAVQQWLDVTPESGIVPPGESTTITVAFDATGLEPGTYTNTLKLSSDDPNHTVTNIQVKLNVLANTPSVVAAIDPRTVLTTSGDDRQSARTRGNEEASGTPEDQSTDRVNIYPVPVQNELHIEIDEQTEVRMALTICNSQGQVVFTDSGFAGKFKNYILNTAGLTKGIYSLQLRYDNRIEARKFLKE